MPWGFKTRAPNGILMADHTNDTALKYTPLNDLHIALGARMVPFAGYSMPVQYTGVLAEHLHTRTSAGLFDVSHMGQAILTGKGVGKAIETLVPGDVQVLEPSRIRYTQFLDEQGNILDDLMITRLNPEGEGESLFLVVNAGCKDADFAHITKHLPQFELKILEDRALLALQGPKAAAVLARRLPQVATMPFMSMAVVQDGADTLYISRSGYTGEDGYEISVPETSARAFADWLLAQPEVLPIGLGARDSLRLEGGLCLYGHDIDTTTNPVEAGLLWSISKRRRQEGGFPGAAQVQKAIADGPKRRRVGILPDGKAPAREGTEITGLDGVKIGTITSGTFGPSLGRPVAMGYVDAAHAAVGTQVQLIVRGKALPAQIVSMPFIPNNFYRGS